MQGVIETKKRIKIIIEKENMKYCKTNSKISLFTTL